MGGDESKCEVNMKKPENSIYRVVTINHVNEYMVSCLFNNGESRLIDFQKLFQDVFKVEEGDPAFILLNDPLAFAQIQIIGSTIGWPDVGIHSTNSRGESVFYSYDLDPRVLYLNSISDPERKPRSARLL